MVDASDFFGLPHRPPFIFIREIIRCGNGAAECATIFADNDPVFAGHFPGNPVVPGVLLTEALAQTAGIAAAADFTDNDPPFFLLSAVRNMKFLRAVLPNERIVLRAQRITQLGDLLQFEVAASVNDVAVAEGQLVLTIAPSPKKCADE